MILWNHLIYLILRPSKVLCPDMQNISYSNSTRTQLDAKIPNEKGIFYFLVQQKQQGHGVTCKCAHLLPALIITDLTELLQEHQIGHSFVFT